MATDDGPWVRRSESICCAGHIRLEQIGVHPHRVKMSPLNDPLWMNVEGASLVHQAGDVGHRDILGVAKAGVKERGAKQRVGHRVERRLKAFYLGL